MKKHIDHIIPAIIKIRQTIHSHPELRYEEHDTAALVLKTLQSFGYQDIQIGIAGTGISVMIDSGKPGKTVALRADMDALPLQEETGVAYQSKHAGKMHACGHDGHTANLLTCAYVLAQCKDQFKGKIKLIFQPAEEGGAGADAMIKEGILENPKVDAIFGLHNWPGAGQGTIGGRIGCLMAGVTDFEVTIHGHGGHAALPHLTRDPIFIGSSIVQALQSISSRKIEPSIPIVVTVGQFTAGSTSNIIPNTALLKGTIRTTTYETQALAKQEFQNIVNGIAQSFGASATITLEDVVPPTVNSEKEAALVFKTAEKLYGKQNVIMWPTPTMGGEDFGFFLEKIPGCYFFIGNGKPEAGLHTSTYNFSDEILPQAAEILCSVAINYLNEN